MRTSIIVDGLLQQGDAMMLHPALADWKPLMQSYRRRWWQLPTTHNALSCYAAMLDVSPAALYLPALKDVHAQQYWVASPYHARVTRDGVRLMPESMLPWSEEDAQALCDRVNPLLDEDGMRLHTVGAALILACATALEVSPQDFPTLNGGMLPNVHPEGVDGGRLMRLLSEIQMLLHQSPMQHRQEQGLPDIHGVWLWGAAEAACDVHTLGIATRHPYLQAVVEANHAQLLLTEAAQYPDLCRSEWMAQKTYLLGAGYAVLLDHPWWYIKRQQAWKPQRVQHTWDMQNLY